MEELAAEKGRSPIPTVDKWTTEPLPDDISWQPTRQRQWMLAKFAQELGNRKRESLHPLRRATSAEQTPELVVKAGGQVIPFPGLAELEHTFQTLAAKWRAETGHISSITKLVMHPSYQRIIGLGPSVLPILFRELKRRRGDSEYWFWALHAITGAKPVADEDMGNIPKMVEAWLDWGRQRGY